MVKRQQCSRGARGRWTRWDTRWAAHLWRAERGLSFLIWNCGFSERVLEKGFLGGLWLWYLISRPSWQWHEWIRGETLGIRLASSWGRDLCPRWRGDSEKLWLCCRSAISSPDHAEFSASRKSLGCVPTLSYSLCFHHYLSLVESSMGWSMLSPDLGSQSLQQWAADISRPASTSPSKAGQGLGLLLQVMGEKWRSRVFNPIFPSVFNTECPLFIFGLNT